MNELIDILEADDNSVAIIINDIVTAIKDELNNE